MEGRAAAKGRVGRHEGQTAGTGTFERQVCSRRLQSKGKPAAESRVERQVCSTGPQQAPLSRKQPAQVRQSTAHICGNDM